MNDLDQLKRSPSGFRIYKSRLPRLAKKGNDWFAPCPFHAEKTGSFSVYVKDGAFLWKCFGCGVGGDVTDMVERFDKVPKNEAIRKVREELGESEKWGRVRVDVEQNFRPALKEEKKSYRTFTLDQYAPTEKALENNQAARDWLLKQRGITYETAKALHFGYKQDIGKLAREENRDIADKGWITIPYIVDGKVALVKYRSIARKEFSRQTGMETTLFNVADIDMFEDLYVVEGDFDAAILKQAGFNAVSIPSASTSLTPAMKDTLMLAGGRILAGDCDGGVGSRAMETLWGALPGSFLLQWPQNMKDANQTFLVHCKGDLSVFRTLVEDLTVSARTTPMPFVQSLQETMMTMKRTDLANHPDRMRFPWPEIDNMAILLPGSVMCLFTTSTGMGKTALVLDFTLDNAINHNEIVLNYQCELSHEELATMAMAYVLKEDRNHLTPADAARAVKKTKGAKYYIGRNPALHSINPVLDLIENAIKRLGATIIVLDHIHFICRGGDHEVQDLASAMQRIKTMAQTYKVKFVVVGQSRKADQKNKGKVVHISDAKGSEAYTSDADAVFALHRDYIKIPDPTNPPSDNYDSKASVHLLKARSKGDGKSYAELMFFGEFAAFYPITYEEPVGQKSIK